MAAEQAAEARKEREFAEALYHGTAERGYEQGSLAEEMPNLNISLQEFKHLSTVIGAHLTLIHGLRSIPF